MQRPANTDLPQLLQRLVVVHARELRALLWSFGYFFCLLCGYYILRPLRDEMGIRGGADNLQWMFTGTFVAMLAVVPVFGWLTRRFSREQFLPFVYLFFIGNLLVFHGLFVAGIAEIAVARAFFIWISVFNLFVVSVFWSFMTDIFDNEQSGRLFGFIAAGGTIGAICGPLLTAALVKTIGTTHLLLVSAVFLCGALLAIRVLLKWCNVSGRTQPARLSGGLLDGIRLVLRSPYLIQVCVMVLLYTSLSTFLYFQQAQIVSDNITDSNSRVRLFSQMEIAVNLLTIALQLLVTGRFISRFGLAVTLALVPALLLFGFISLGVSASLGVIVVVQTLRRAGDYAIMRPAREMLFVVLPREQKYKAKNFIDTAVYRGGDAVSGWVYAGLSAAGIGVGAIALIAMPVTAAWMWISYRLGRSQPRQAQH